MSAALPIRSEEWHAERRKGLGASDVAAVCGLSPFAKPIDVFQEKRGLVEPRDETASMRWGNLLEPVIADEFTAATGIKVRRLARAVRYRDWPVLFAHLDRVTADAVCEIKLDTMRRGWGEAGTDEIPDHVRVQVQAQMACADKERAYVVACLGLREPTRWYEVARDRELFGDAILPILREFWRLVEANEPPEADGSDAYGRFLRAKYPTDAGTERAATPEEQLIALGLIEAKAARIAAGLREDEAQQRLMDSMGTTTRLDGPGWHVTWKQSKARTTVTWELVARAYREAIEEALRANELRGLASLDLAVVEGLYTETKAGTRPFLFRVKQEEE